MFAFFANELKEIHPLDLTILNFYIWISMGKMNSIPAFQLKLPTPT